MRQRKLYITACLIFIVSGVESFAEDIDFGELSSRKARSAASTYQRKVKAAEQDFDKVVSSAQKNFAEVVAREREELIDALEDVLKQETSKGNLEEAVKLKSAISSLKSQAAEEGIANQQAGRFLGLWRIQYHDGVVRYNQFFVQNGQPMAMRFVNPREKHTDQGAVMVKDGMVLVKYKNYPAIEQFHINADRLFVEHWIISEDSSIERYPNLLGIATNVDPQTGE